MAMHQSLRELFIESTRWTFRHYFDPVTVPIRWLAAHVRRLS